MFFFRVLDIQLVFISKIAIVDFNGKVILETFVAPTMPVSYIVIALSIGLRREQVVDHREATTGIKPSDLRTSVLYYKTNLNQL